ncbi:hypothetical protein F5Y06DRAFT_265429 [Hypoxylon sp. FL0890]|nr:hypothetical protein F5Y06DRAFT_265429 [Hypoxylon sp. FL0890]
MTVSMAADRAYPPDSNPQESKPGSGFTPLPPIRRTSTFDLLSRKKFGSDDDDRAPSPVGSSDNDVPPVPPLKEDMNYHNGNGHIPSQGQGGQANVQSSQPHNFNQPPQQHPAFSNGPAQNLNGYATGRGAPQPNGFQQPMFMGRGGPVGPPNQFGQMPGQSGAMPMPNQGQQFMSHVGGNPIQKIPPGPWKLEESHLSEPLIQHKRPGANSPLQQQPGYYAYDKETEDAIPPVKGQMVSRTRPRNNSNSIPPVSAERFRNHNIFVPHGHEPSQGVPQQQQPGHPLLRGQHNNFPNQAERGVREAGPSKEMDVRVDEVSVSSVNSEEQPKEPGRRGSGFFGLGPRRNTGAEQGPDQSTPAKEKGSFFGGVANHNKFQPKQKSNLGLPGTSSFDHDDTPPPVSMKKRLSELTGMIKGVGNAKDGAKDDQTAKPSTGYASRPSMQGPMRTLTGQGTVGQPSPLGSPPIGMTRSNTSGLRPGETQQPQGEDEKKHGGFLGGFFNKQGSKAPESKQPSQQIRHPAQRPPQQFPMQPGQQFQPGQMPPPRQQFGPQQMYGVQPPIQEGVQGQPGMRRPMAPGQLSPPENVTSPSSPQFLGMAQAVMMRRPSEITVSQGQPGGSPLSPGQRSQFPSQQGPQMNARPSTAQDAQNINLNKQTGREDFSMSSALPKDSPHSRPTSPERFDAGGSPIATRTTPNRKPVGSGFSRQDGASTSSAPTSQSAASPTKPSDPSSQPYNAEDEKRLSSHLPSGQQSPTLGKLGHVRQTSLPSPGRPPILSKPGQVTFAPAAGSSPLSPRGPMSPQDRQPPRQSHETSQGQPGMSQPSQGQSGYLASPSGASPQHNLWQNPQAWGPNYSFANQQHPGLSQHGAQGVPRFIGNPAIPPDQQKTIAKFFGVDGKGKNLPTAQPPKELKEKEKSAASKLLGAFKRGSKQSDPQQPQHQRPPPGHQSPPHVPRPQQGGPPQQGTATRPQISEPLPAGPLGPMSGLPSQGPTPPGQGRGAPLPPGQPGYGQMGPPMMTGAGRGEIPPHMQAGRGQNPQAGGLKAQALGQQRRKSAQNLEPQYDQVPIPRGYEAVHGYGNAGMIAPSPYNVGRPSPPPPQQQQFQSFVPQVAPQQQWDPRTMPPPGQHAAHLQPGQPGQQAQSIQRSTESESSTPTPSEQGTFLDMAPTPPPRQSQDEYRFDSQAPPPVPPQFLRGQPSQPQVRTQANPQLPKSVDTQTPSSSKWGSAPDSTRSPQSQRKPDAPIFNMTLNSKPSDPNVSPPSDNDEGHRPQHQHQHPHIATAISNNPAQIPMLQPGSPQTGPLPGAPRAFSPTASPPARQLPGVPNPGPQAQPPQEAEIQVAPGPAANRLVSKMSTSNMNAMNAAQEPPKNTSLSPDIIANRATNVSPEPTIPRSMPFHQVSNTSLNINVDRANDVTKGGEDDIYDATPRVNRSLGEAHGQGQGQIYGQTQAQVQGQEGSHENTKYAGSSPHVNGAVVAGAAVGAGAGAVIDAGIVEEAVGQEPGPGPGPASDDSSLSEEKIAVPMDHEEKILVEQPVELAAVNDDDDGIPVMSATSYPGQEWNPYGAGEFGDWD